MGLLDWFTDPYGLEGLEYDEETGEYGTDAEEGPSLWESVSQQTVELLGGWEAGAEQTGSASEAADQAEVWTDTVATARNWSSSQLGTALGYIAASEDVADSALSFWQTLLNAWPADSSLAGWDELGDTFQSSADASGATYTRAVAILQEFLPDPNEWERILRFAAGGAAAGLALGLTTKLNPTVGTLAGAVVGGVYARNTPKEETFTALAFLE
jgi:hypothetical protein